MGSRSHDYLFIYCLFHTFCMYFHTICICHFFFVHVLHNWIKKTLFNIYPIFLPSHLMRRINGQLSRLAAGVVRTPSLTGYRDIKQWDNISTVLWPDTNKYDTNILWSMWKENQNKKCVEWLSYCLNVWIIMDLFIKVVLTINGFVSVVSEYT